jgi:hypothetical protein
VPRLQAARCSVAARGRRGRRGGETPVLSRASGLEVTGARYSFVLYRAMPAASLCSRHVGRAGVSTRSRPRVESDCGGGAPHEQHSGYIFWGGDRQTGGGEVSKFGR